MAGCRIDMNTERIVSRPCYDHMLPIVIDQLKKTKESRVSHFGVVCVDILFETDFRPCTGTILDNESYYSTSRVAVSSIRPTNVA